MKYWNFVAIQTTKTENTMIVAFILLFLLFSDHNPNRLKLFPDQVMSSAGQSSTEVARSQEGMTMNTLLDIIGVGPSNTDDSNLIVSNPADQPNSNLILSSQTVRPITSNPCPAVSFNDLQNLDNISTESLGHMIDNSRGHAALYNGVPVQLLTPVETYILKRNVHFTPVSSNPDENCSTSNNNPVTQMPMRSNTFSSTAGSMTSTVVTTLQSSSIEASKRLEIAETKMGPPSVDTVVCKQVTAKKFSRTAMRLHSVDSFGGVLKSIDNHILVSKKTAKKQKRSYAEVVTTGQPSLRISSKGNIRKNNRPPIPVTAKQLDVNSNEKLHEKNMSSSEDFITQIVKKFPKAIGMFKNATQGQNTLPMIRGWADKSLNDAAESQNTLPMVRGLGGWSDKTVTVLSVVELPPLKQSFFKS